MMKFAMTMVVGVVGLCNQPAFGQVNHQGDSFEYSGVHPLIAAQQAQRMAFETSKSKIEFRQQAAEQRRSAIRQRMEEKLAVYRSVAANYAQERSATFACFADRVDPLTGNIEWPERLAKKYPQETAEIARHFRRARFTVASGDCGDSHIHATCQSCKRLQAKMKQDLQRNRCSFGAAEYLSFKKLLNVLPEHAKVPSGMLIDSPIQ